MSFFSDCNDTKKKIIYIIAIIIAILFLPLIFVIWAFVRIPSYIRKRILCLAVKWKWMPKGKNMLFVYSNSPNWQEYIEENIIPKIKDRAVIINWSKRKQWNKRSLEVKIFKQWSGAGIYFKKGSEGSEKEYWGGRNYNPIAIVFSSWWKEPKVFRFWPAFKDWKHGKTETLKKLEDQFFNNKT